MVHVFTDALNILLGFVQIDKANKAVCQKLSFSEPCKFRQKQENTFIGLYYSEVKKTFTFHVPKTFVFLPHNSAH